LNKGSGQKYSDNQPQLWEGCLLFGFGETVFEGKMSGVMKVLDEKALRTELATAVASDRRRKAVDEMKKRSILTAGSYDEFRHLVKCAENDQKPLTTKEMMAVNGTAVSLSFAIVFLHIPEINSEISMIYLKFYAETWRRGQVKVSIYDCS